MDIRKIWKNKFRIIAGILNSWFPSTYVKNIAKKRLIICESNICGLYDEKGTSDKCQLKGTGCCSGCGCVTKYKVSSLSSFCYLKELGLTPLWDSEMTQKEEDAFKSKNKITDL